LNEHHEVKEMSENPRILVIDDDENVRKILSAVLVREGYSVDTAKNGEEAIEKSKRNFYNMALIDIRLPDMEGTKLLTTMKETVPKMVKLIMTGYPTLDNAVESVNRSADGYLIKPINIDRLLETIKAHLRKQQETMEYTQERVAEFIETRTKELRRLSEF